MFFSLALLLACPGNGETDADGDGVSEVIDCDDADPEVGAAATWHADADGDGFGSEATVEACEQPTGFVARGEDCDDTDPSTWPGAPEICGDGIDSDCADGDTACERLDGELSVADATLELQGVVPGETCGRAVDAGDDGAWIACTRGADNAGRVAWMPEGEGVRQVSDTVTFDGEVDDGQAGRDLTIGDADGDGVEDLLVGSYGASMASLHLGPHETSGRMSDGHAVLLGAAGAEAGRGVALIDLDQDGVDDVLVGQPSGAGDVAWSYVPITGEVTLDDADGWILGDVQGSGAGAVVESAGDVDGDGLPDVLIGASLDPTGGTRAGSASLVLGPPGDVSLADSEARWFGEQSYQAVGYALSSGDVDGDGHRDVVLGVHGDDFVGYYGGNVRVALGPHGGDQPISAAEWTFLPSADAWFLGISVDAADLDGNGALDLVAGGHGYADYAGAAWVVYGPLTGGVAMLNADAMIVGLDLEDAAGFAVSAWGEGVLVGAYKAAGADTETGAAYWMLPE